MSWATGDVDRLLAVLVETQSGRSPRIRRDEGVIHAVSDPTATGQLDESDPLKSTPRDRDFRGEVPFLPAIPDQSEKIDAKIPLA